MKAFIATLIVFISVLYGIYKYPQQFVICVIGVNVMVLLIGIYAVIRDIINDERHLFY